MKEVASLRYDVIFKKAFRQPAIFTAFVSDFVGIKLNIDQVETDKTFKPAIGRVATRFDLYAEDQTNRLVIDLQHERHSDHYHRFLHYHCVALLEQIINSKNYRPNLKVFTLVVLTSGDKHQNDISIIDFDPKNRQGQPLGEIDHKIIYICPKYLQDDTPTAYREWMAAIEDSLDEQVDESHYTRPEIQQLFQLIEKDQITPEERAQMFEEYNQEELKHNLFQRGKEEGLKEVALHLLSLGSLTTGQIAEVTGLTLEEIQNLVRK